MLQIQYEQWSRADDDEVWAERMAAHFKALPAGAKEVDVNDWMISSGILATYDVECCTVLAARNRDTQQGLLAHAGIVATEQPEDRILQTALNLVPHLGPLATTDLWLGGASTAPGEGIYDLIMDDRREAEGLLRPFQRELGSYAICWAEPDTDCHVVLDNEAGVLQVCIEPSEFRL